MSFKQYLVLLLLFLIYMTLGAYMFYSVERPLEEERRALAKAEALEIRELLRRHYAQGLPQAHMELLSRLSDYCGKPFFIDSIPMEDAINDSDTNTSINDIPEEDPFDEKPILWTFYNSFLFVMCTLSTIGYGNLAPTSRHTRILDVIYGLIGIPFTGIVLAQMAEYFGSLFMRAHHRYKSHEFQTRTSLIADIITYTILGMIIFIFFPAAIFIYFEDWTFDTGVYYAFVTLATIGYGDLVAGQNQTDSWVYTVYKVMVVVWIMFGLGYMLMIVGFLTRVMRSKKVRKIEHKLANTIKATQSKIWNEFSQDVTYLRRMLNEMYLLKITPVYVEKEEEDKEGIRRVKSCPNLTEWPVLRKKQEGDEESEEEDEEKMAEKFRRIAMRRRKGNAENLMAPRITKTVSEGDLSRIDRKATFGDDSSSVEPKLLLARVVDALGTSVGSKFSLDSDCGHSRKVSTQVNGIHGFSDDEILASERLPSRWSLGARKHTPTEQPAPEARTWGGVNPADIQKFIMMRANGELRRRSSQTQDTKSVSSSCSSVSEHSLKFRQSRMRRMSMAVTNLFSHTNKNKPQEEKYPKELRESKRKKRRTGNMPGMLPTVRDNKRHSLPDDEEDTHSVVEQANYLSQTGGRRSSVFAALANELTTSTAVSNIPVSPVLEQTSVADFLRLLSSLQAKLDPTMSLPTDTQDQFMNRRKPTLHPSKDTANPLAMLFSHPITASHPAHHFTVEPVELPRRGSRCSTIFNKTPNFLEVDSKQGRRFSLIPPMDVDHPSDQINLKDMLKLKRRSTSSQNMHQQSDITTVNIPGGVSRARSSRPSLTGTAKYISSKFQGSLDPPKSVQGSTMTSEGFRKFSVRPVSGSEYPLPSDVTTSLPMTLQNVPTITVENVDGETTRDGQDEDRLQGVLVVKL